MMKKMIKIISAIMVCTLLFLCTGCAVTPRQIVNLGDFVKVNQQGYDGHGITEFYIDYEQIINLCEAPDVNKENMRAHIQQSFYPYTLSVTTCEKTKNGQIIPISFIESSTDLIDAFRQGLNIEIRADAIEYVIKDLPALTNVDFFDMMIVDSHNTVSGTGVAEFKTSCTVNGERIVFNLKHNGENGKLKNGDKLTVTIDDSYDMEAFILSTGHAPETDSKEITIDFLAEYAIDQTILDHLNPEGDESINQVMDDWVVSGANDYSDKATHNRQYRCVGYVVHTNTDSIETVDKSVLSAVYVVNDKLMQDDYFVTMSITGILAYDKDNRISLDGAALPKSFVYYDKETVKWEEITGWEQGSEGQGFLFGSTPYAGHLTLQDAFNFLRTQYGEQYEFVYTNLPVDVYVVEAPNGEPPEEIVDVERDEG
ncbi:MAG: hypothetical protein IJ419_02120 [Agathobacter sp.]|nr:hypothetical protein [Agathobacter sp.]